MVTYNVYLSNYGWSEEKHGGEVAGKDDGSNIEGFYAKLDDSLNEMYSIEYRTYISGFGWTEWARDGEYTGSKDYGLVITSLDVRIVYSDVSLYASNGTGQAYYERPSVQYNVHMQDYGWLGTVGTSQVSGKPNQGKRVEAITVTLPANLTKYGSLNIQTHVQDYGWLGNVGNGQVAGTTGQGKRVEAFQLSLTGELANRYNILYQAYVDGLGCQPTKKNGAVAGTTGQSRAIQAIRISIQYKYGPQSSTGMSEGEYIQNLDQSIFYQAHVQNIGWQNTVMNYETAGTTGQSLRVESLKVTLSDDLAQLGGVSIRAHVQDYGWMNPVTSNQVAGTTGQSKRVEAVQMSLTGELANQYDVIYRVHVQDIGWQNWVRNGRIAGTTGQSKRIEAIQIYLRNKADRVKIENVDKTVSYSAHVQDYGWLNAVTNGNIGGTVGQSKRMEAIQVSLSDDMLEYGDVNVQAHVQDYGWLGTVGNGQIAGTTGQNKRLEGLKITLTDELANHYDIYYRAHVGNIGWLGWTKNGGIAGSVGCNRRIEAVQIAIYAKNDPNAPKVGNSQTTSVENPQYTPTYYSQRDPRWAGATYNGYNLQSTGCVPTAVAMVVDGILHNGVTPNIMADYLVTTGEFAGRKHGGSGLAIRYGAEHWGLKTTGIGDYGTLVNCLNAGNIVVFQVGAGTFTSRGSTHAIVLFRNSGGNTYVYDPWNAHNGWYSISMIWNQRSTNSYDLTGGYVGYGIYQ